MKWKLLHLTSVLLIDLFFFSEYLYLKKQKAAWALTPNMADGGDFDPCECIFNHEMAMRRLLSLLRSVTNSSSTMRGQWEDYFLSSGQFLIHLQSWDGNGKINFSPQVSSLFIFNHEMAMKRLLSLLRSVTNSSSTMRWQWKDYFFSSGQLLIHLQPWDGNGKITFLLSSVTYSS